MDYTGDISHEDRQYVEDVLALYTGLKKYEDKHPDEQLAASHRLQFRGFDASRPLKMNISNTPVS